jgi:hypothetical protein
MAQSFGNASLEKNVSQPIKHKKEASSIKKKPPILLCT